MKNIKTILASAVLLALAISANAQTLTRSLVLKPAGETETLTLTSSSGITTGYTIFFPGGGEAAAAGPFMKVTTASGNKTVSFGQVNLASNAAAGDVTGTLKVTNGGTGLNSIGAGVMLYGSGGDALNTLSPGTDNALMTLVSGVPAWTNVGNLSTNVGSAPATNINTSDLNDGSGTESVTNIGYNDPDGALVANGPSTTNIYGNTTIGSLTGDGGGPTSLVINSNTTFNGNVTLPLGYHNIWKGNSSGDAAEYAPGSNGTVLTVVAGDPTWSNSIGNSSDPFTITSNDLNLNAVNGGEINIGNNLTGGNTANINIGSSNGPTTTTFYGDIVFDNMPDLPLTENYMYVGNASNLATELPTTASSVLTSNGSGVPTWSSVISVPNGGTGLSSITSGSLVYGNGVGAMNTLPIGTAGKVLTSSGTAPQWSNVGDLLAGATLTYTVTGADAIAGYAVIDETGQSIVTNYGYSASSRVFMTYETASGPAVAANVSTRTGTSFRVYCGLMTAGDKINIIIVNP